MRAGGAGCHRAGPLAFESRQPPDRHDPQAGQAEVDVAHRPASAARARPLSLEEMPAILCVSDQGSAHGARVSPRGIKGGHGDPGHAPLRGAPTLPRRVCTAPATACVVVAAPQRACAQKVVLHCGSHCVFVRQRSLQQAFFRETGRQEFCGCSALRRAIRSTPAGASPRGPAALLGGDPIAWCRCRGQAPIAHARSQVPGHADPAGALPAAATWAPAWRQPLHA